MVNGTVLLATSSDSTEVGEFAIREAAGIPLVALAKDLPMSLENPVAWPIFGFW